MKGIALTPEKGIVLGGKSTTRFGQHATVETFSTGGWLT
jgi:hypothetical protein